MTNAHERDLSRVDITPQMIASALKLPGSFALSRDAEHADDIGETWSLGPVIESRDSTIRERANRIALIRYLESIPELADDWTITGCSHWAVGWVDHLTYRVVDADGEPTRMMRELALWFGALTEYPIADDTLLSEMEWEAVGENWPVIASDLRHSVRKVLSARGDWSEAIADALDELTADEIHEIAHDYGEMDDGWIRYSSHDVERIALKVMSLPRFSSLALDGDA